MVDWLKLKIAVKKQMDAYVGNSDKRHVPWCERVVKSPLLNCGCGGLRFGTGVYRVKVPCPYGERTVGYRCKVPKWLHIELI